MKRKPDFRRPAGPPQNPEANHPIGLPCDFQPPPGDRCPFKRSNKTMDLVAQSCKIHWGLPMVLFTCPLLSLSYNSTPHCLKPKGRCLKGTPLGKTNATFTGELASPRCNLPRSAKPGSGNISTGAFGRNIWELAKTQSQTSNEKLYILFPYS